MSKVYLVTSKETGYEYGDSLWVEGVFSTIDKAFTYMKEESVRPVELTVTAMTIDDTSENDNRLVYPFASYIE